MRTVREYLGEYGASHENPTNELLHWICVPLIVLTVFGLLRSLPVPMLFAQISPWVNWATVAALGQFIGHAIEAKRPSFFKDLQFLLIGPLWLLAAAYRKIGLSY